MPPLSPPLSLRASLLVAALLTAPAAPAYIAGINQYVPQGAVGFTPGGIAAIRLQDPQVREYTHPLLPNPLAFATARLLAVAALFDARAPRSPPPLPRALHLSPLPPPHLQVTARATSTTFAPPSPRARAVWPPA